MPFSTGPVSTVNWVAVELAYTSTIRTLEDIGHEHGITKGRVSQKAKEMGWIRGALTDRVRVRAEAKVAAVDAHNAQVQAGTEEALDATAVLMANTILRERKDVMRLMTVANTLLGKLEGQVQPFTVAAQTPKPEPLAAQIESLRKLADTMTRLVLLERNVLGITDATPIDPSKRMGEAVKSGLDELKARFQRHLAKAA